MESSALQLIGGIALLYAGGEALVRGAESLALRLGISPLLIGLTVVAFATSTPELVVSVGAALGGHGDVALGNVVGSNICNVGLILGIAAVIRPVRTQIQLLRFDVPILIACSGALFLVLLDGEVGRSEGFGLLAGIVVYQAFCIWQVRCESEAAAREISDSLPVTTTSVVRAIGLVVVGVAALVSGGHFFVDGAISLARALGVSEAVVALSVVALGTSLPELSATLVATLKGHPDMAAGNAIGSCIFNLLAVLGATAAIAPLAQGAIGTADLAVMTMFAVLLLPLMITGSSLTRAEGGLMVAGYVAYVAWLAV